MGFEGAYVSRQAAVVHGPRELSSEDLLCKCDKFCSTFEGEQLQKQSYVVWRRAGDLQSRAAAALQLFSVQR